MLLLSARQTNDFKNQFYQMAKLLAVVFSLTITGKTIDHEIVEADVKIYLQIRFLVLIFV